MWINRKRSNLITKQDAEILRSAVEEKRCLSFPLSVVELGLVAGTIFSAQKFELEFNPSFRQRLLARLNYSYASVTSFILWIGANNVTIKSHYPKDSKKLSLMVTLRQDHSINWSELKEKEFSSKLFDIK